MALPFLRQRESRAEVIELPIESLLPNPSQPRKVFEAQGLRELALSIEQHGILQPLSVRRSGGGYVLIAGERRLRAAKLAHLSTVPCLIVDADEEESALLSLIENLQRKDLDFIEVAHGYRRLMQDYGMTQEQTALRVGKSQSAVANKLRLLKFSDEQIRFIRASGLSERHCRSILRLPEESFMKALEYVALQGLTVAQTEMYVENLTISQPEMQEGPVQKEAEASEKEAIHPLKPVCGKRTALVHDVRIFLNTIDRAFDVMRASGINADCERHELDEYTELVIRIPHNRRHTVHKNPRAV